MELAALGDSHEQMRGDRRPDFRVHAVEGGAVEPAQTEVLFDPANDLFDGPAPRLSGAMS